MSVTLLSLLSDRTTDSRRPRGDLQRFASVNSDHPSPLARLVAQIKRDRPDIYRELRRRHVESILAIEHGQVTSWDDNTDPDCEDQLPLLQRDLISLGILRR